MGHNPNGIPWPIPGYCACGCGQQTTISRYGDRSKGWVKGEPRKYVNGHTWKGRSHSDESIAVMQSKKPTGEDALHWRGGRYVDSHGYVQVWIPRDHWLRSMVTGSRYAKEHRIVMAEHLGRPLRSDEIVHHRNEIKDDNRIENLQLVTSAEHTRIHAALRREIPPMPPREQAAWDALDDAAKPKEDA